MNPQERSGDIARNIVSAAAAAAAIRYPEPSVLFGELLEVALGRSTIQDALRDNVGTGIEDLRTAVRDNEQAIAAEVAAEEQAYAAAVREADAERQAALAREARRSGRGIRPPSVGVRAGRARPLAYASWVASIVLLVVVAAGSILLAGQHLFGSWGFGWSSLAGLVVVAVVGGASLGWSNGRHTTVEGIAFGLAITCVAVVPGVAIGYDGYWLSRATGLSGALSVVVALVAPVLGWSFLAATTYLPRLWRTDGEAANRASVLDSTSRESIDSDDPWERSRRAERQAQVALESFREALLERAILGFLRGLIDDRRKAEYGVTLAGGDWSGLWRTGYENYHVETPAATELSYIMERLGGGSIGIYGPRGAGKTHLIRAFCEGRYTGERDLTILVSAPVDYSPREFVTQIDAMLCQRVLVRLGAPGSIVEDGRKVDSFRRPGRYLLPFLARRSPSTAPVSDDADRGLRALTRQIQDHRQRLFYLSNHSDGLAGKVGGPVAEVSATQGWAITEQPRTYPEAVESFRTILADIVRALADEPVSSAVRDGRRPRVVIGIDDLDRIESPERARSFLHEIKAIFGVAGCFYLVSISDEAMSDFNRGGAFQGLFDSAFDERVRVPGLDVNSARQVLVQRTLSMSEPFRFLAYCLAGGPARELVRVARAIAALDLRRAADDPLLTLGEVSSRLVSEESRLLCRVLQARLAPHEWRSVVAETCVAFDEIGRFGATAANLRTGIERLTVAAAQAPELWSASHHGLTALYHLMTVLEIFTNDIDAQRLVGAGKAAPGSSAFDELARARLETAISPLAAWLLIDRVRRSFALPLLPYAAQLTSGRGGGLAQSAKGAAQP